MRTETIKLMAIETWPRKDGEPAVYEQFLEYLPSEMVQLFTAAEIAKLGEGEVVKREYKSHTLRFVNLIVHGRAALEKAASNDWTLAD